MVAQSRVDCLGQREAGTRDRALCGELGDDLLMEDPELVSTGLDSGLAPTAGQGPAESDIYRPTTVEGAAPAAASTRRITDRPRGCSP